MPENSEVMLEAKKEAARQLVALAAMVITLMVVAIATKPDSFREYRMRAAEASRRLLTYLARRAGHISMGTELRSGIREYSVPYHLSLLRDRVKDYYDRIKEKLCLSGELRWLVT